MRRAAAVVAVVAVCLALAGCTSGAPATKATSGASSALTTLQPDVPKTLTAANAKTSTVNLANEIDKLIASTDVVYVDDHSKLVAATKSTASYYGVLRTITVSTGLDPLQQAEAMEKLLVEAGWKEDQTSTVKGKYIAAMSSNAAAPARSWFLLLGGDSTVAKQPVVTVQLASPDLP